MFCLCVCVSGYGCSHRAIHGCRAWTAPAWGIAPALPSGGGYRSEKKKRGCFSTEDMGGGTFDVSLLTIEDGIFEVKAAGLCAN